MHSRYSEVIIFRPIAIAISLILSSCTVYDEGLWPIVEQINIEDHPHTVFFSTDIVSSLSFIKAKHFYVWADSILVTVNNPSTDKKVVVLSYLSSSEIIGEYLGYGNGPNEVLICTDHLYRDTLYINDVAKNKLYYFVLPDIVRTPHQFDSISVFDYHGYGPTPFVTMIDKRSILCENPYHFSDRKSHIYNTAKNRFDRYCLGDERMIIHTNYKYDTYNVSQGIIVPIIEKNRVYYASSSKPLIEIYDKEGTRIKRLTGPSELPANYSIHNGSIEFKERIPYSYLGYCLTNSFLYLNYIGGYFEDGFHNLHSTIIKFDFDGNLIESFILPEYVSSFSIVDDNLIYGKGYNNQGETVLKKFFRQ